MGLNKYNILITPSSEHFKQTLTVMVSAMINCKSNCRFFIMEFNWSDDQKKICLEFVAKYPGNKVEFIHVDNSAFELLKSWRGYFNCYYKMLAHEYLPSEIDRVLYIDTDVIINKDIYRYYSMDFEDNFLIASNDAISKQGYEKLFNVSEPGSGHINTGVLMINLDKFRKEKITIENYCNTITESNNDYLADQGILSFIFKERIKVLPSYKYQYKLHHVGDVYGYEKIFAMTKEQRRECLCPPYWDEDIDLSESETIIHFAGYVSKPWSCVYTVDDGKASIYIPFLSHALKPSMVEHLYLRWWDYAKQLPLFLYEEFLSNSAKKKAEIEVKKIENTQLRFTTNMYNFFSELSSDCICGSCNFIRFITNLSGKKISILTNGDSAGKFLSQCAQKNNASIVFTTFKRALMVLTPEEWEKCKKADVIINCCIHGSKSENRDGINDITLWDIIRENSLTSNQSRLNLALSNNELLEEIQSAKSVLSKQSEQIREMIIGLNAEVHKNKSLIEEQAALRSETINLNKQLQDMKTKYTLLQKDFAVQNQDFNRREKQLQNALNYAEEMNEKIAAQFNEMSVAFEFQERDSKLKEEHLQNALDYSEKMNKKITTQFNEMSAAFELQERDSKLKEEHLQNALKCAEETNKKITIQFDEAKESFEVREDNFRSREEQLCRQIDDYEQSKSWRITKPLRSIAWFFRRLFGKTK